MKKKKSVEDRGLWVTAPALIYIVLSKFEKLTCQGHVILQISMLLLSKNTDYFFLIKIYAQGHTTIVKNTIFFCWVTYLLITLHHPLYLERNHKCKDIRAFEAELLT